MENAGRKTKYTWKRFWFLVAFAVFFLLMGFGVRYAEYNQVGYTNDASMWVFGFSAIFGYFAGLVLFFLLRRR